jgi:hypothetical protein
MCTHAHMILMIPHELFNAIDNEMYKDKDAKNAKHFSLMLVDKQFYAYFNKDEVWKKLFSMYFQLTDRKEREIPITRMKIFLRLQFSLQRTQKRFTLFRKENLLGYDPLTKVYAAKSSQLQKMRQSIGEISFPSLKLSKEYIRYLSDIDLRRKCLSKTKRTGGAFKKNVKNKKQSSK